MTGPSNNNQRVTNAILGGKMDSLLKGFEEMKDAQKEQNRQIRVNSDLCIEHSVLWKQHDKEHVSLNTKKWAGDIGAAIAGALTAVGITVAKS